MSEEALKIIGEIQHVRLEPDDVIVVTCRMPITDEMYRRIEAGVKSVFSGHRMIILDRGVRMEVARRGGSLDDKMVSA